MKKSGLRNSSLFDIFGVLFMGHNLVDFEARLW